MRGTEGDQYASGEYCQAGPHNCPHVVILLDANLTSELHRRIVILRPRSYNDASRAEPLCTTFRHRHRCGLFSGRSSFSEVCRYSCCWSRREIRSRLKRVGTECFIPILTTLRCSSQNDTESVTH